MSSAQRRKQLQTDIESIRSSFSSDTVAKIIWNEDDRNLSTVFSINGATLSFNFYIPEDFPDMRPFCSVESSVSVDNILEKINAECEKSKSTIQSIIGVLTTELSKQFGINIIRDKTSTLEDTSKTSIKRQASLRTSGSLKRSLGSSGKWRKESQDVEGDEDDSYEDDEEMLEAEYEDGNEENMFLKHCKQAQLLFGDSSIMVYRYIDTVRFMLNTSGLDSKLFPVLDITDRNQNIVVSIQFTSAYIEDKQVPKVKVIHPQIEDTILKCGFGEQIENLVSNFLEKRWPILRLQQNEQPFQKLCSMGFDPILCTYALEEYHYDLEAAAAYLTERAADHSSKSLSNSSSSNSNNSLSKSNSSGILGRLKKTFSDAKTTSQTTSKPILLHLNDMKLELLPAQLAMAVALHRNALNIEKAYEELLKTNRYESDFLNNLMNWPAAAQLGGTKNNFILELMVYLIRRIPSAMGHCLICDERIAVEGYEGFNPLEVPTICTKGTCQFNYLELGVCSSLPIAICPTSLADDIKNNGDVVDLLISMVFTAGTSQRRDVIFNPSPPEYSKNFAQLEKVLNLFPSVEEMSQHCTNESHLMYYLNTIDPEGNVYRLLRWILTVNRAALLKIPVKNQIPQMQTPYQYLMMSGGSPEKTTSFKQMRKAYGSYFAFHGSGIENWHSILRRGLLNCSNTNMMTTGAAYGPGIYCAPNSSTSFGYAKTGKGWTKSRFGDVSRLTCLAIVEVVKHPSVPITPSPHYVIRESDYVATRFFLFYPANCGTVNVNASDLKLNQFIAQ